MSTERGQGELVGLLEAHRYALGHEGIVSDGYSAALGCTCGWRENFELPDDDIRHAERRWNQHIAEQLATHVDAEVAAALEGFSLRASEVVTLAAIGREQRGCAERCGCTDCDVLAEVAMLARAMADSARIVREQIPTPGGGAV